MTFKKLLAGLFLALPLLTSVASAQVTNLWQGGTGLATSSPGDLIVGTSSPLRYTRLPKGSVGQLLQVSATAPFLTYTSTSSLGFSVGLTNFGLDFSTHNLTATGTLDVTGKTTLGNASTSNISGNLFSTNGYIGSLTANNASTTNLSATGAFLASLFSTNASTTNLSASGLFSTNSFFTNASTTNLSATGAFLASLFSTNASTTNLSATTAVFTNATTTLGAFTRSTTTNAFISNASTTNLSASGLFSTNAFFTNASTTNISGNLFSTSAFISNASTTNLSSSGLFSTNAFVTNASTTNLSATGAFLASVFSSNASTTNFSATGATITNLFVPTKALIGNASTTNISTSGAVHDSVGSAGTSGQVLQSTGTSSLWISLGNGISNLYASSTFALLFANLSTNNIVATGTLNVTGLTTLGNASTTAISGNGFFPNMFSTNASTTNLSASGLFSTNSFFTNASTTNLSATGFTVTNEFITGNASTTKLSVSSGFTGANGFFTGTLDVAGKTTLGNASTTAMSGNLFSTNAFISNASTTNLSASGLFSTNSFFTNASTTNVSATGAFLTSLFSTNASTTNLSATGFTGANEFITGTATIVNASTTRLSATTGATLTDTLFTGLLDFTSSRFRINNQGGISVATSAVPIYGFEIATTTKFLAGSVQRVSGYVSASTITVNLNNTDIATTTVDRTTTFANPTGTEFDGGMFELRLLATTSQTIAFGTKFASSTDLAYPTTVASGTTRILWEYSQDRAKWDLVGLLKTYDR